MKFLRVNGYKGTVMSEKTSVQVEAQRIHIETGKLAKQADGAVTVQLGETIVIVAAVAATSAKPGQDFFPLTVDYRGPVPRRLLQARRPPDGKGNTHLPDD